MIILLEKTNTIKNSWICFQPSENEIDINLFGNFCQCFCFRVVVIYCMSIIVFQSKNANCYIPFNTLLFLSSGIKGCRTCFVSSFHFLEISGNLPKCH